MVLRYIPNSVPLPHCHATTVGWLYEGRGDNKRNSPDQHRNNLTAGHFYFQQSVQSSAGGGLLENNTEDTSHFKNWDF